MHKAAFTIAGIISLLAVPATLSAQTYGELPSVSEALVAADLNGAAAPASSAKRVVAVEQWIEEWDEASQSWIRVEGSRETNYAPTFAVAASQPAERLYSPAFRPQNDVAAAQYGPFKVIDGDRAALVGPTNSQSPQYFDMMLADFPKLGVLEIVEGPGTSDDVANLKVGRKIREAGLTTRIGAGGSARSGAVELFLAGDKHVIEDGAEFAVHSWRDNFGREPSDYAPNAPENRFYLDYYEEMGMSDKQARAFYDMTNSVPHVSALWLDAQDMRPWVAGMSAAETEIERAVFVFEAAPIAPIADIAPIDVEDFGVLEVPAPQLAYQDVSFLDT